MKIIFQHIHERFPEKMHLINKLVADSPDFMELCRDYDDSIHALRYWARSDEVDAGLRFNEYLTLVRDLEMDIQQFLVFASRND